MNIGIIGTRGIPNHYGGFEQFAEIFACNMVKKGHRVTVYSSHTHPYKESQFGGVHIIHCKDPEHRIGTFGQFIYDYNCIKDAGVRDFDLILQLGYTSSTIWSWLFPKSALLVTNMDGLEWRRSKYRKPVQWFLKFAEKWGVRYSDHLIADSKGIQAYLHEKYRVNASYVPYGAIEYFPEKKPSLLKKYGIIAGQYDLVVARFEPENNIETFLKAYVQMPERKFLLVGNYNDTRFGKRVYARYAPVSNIIFANGIYDNEKLNTLRYNSRIYFHGHSVGGTNPSLLEAMACRTLICAHKNQFNASILQGNAFYFTEEKDILQLAGELIDKRDYQDWIGTNIQAIRELYNWDVITDQLEAHFIKWLKERSAHLVRQEMAVPVLLTQTIKQG